jgi:DNA-binding response OmpR family regulator
MKAKVLIIDDDSKLIRLLSEYLVRFDFQVLAALHPDDGLTQLRIHHPDLIVLDVMLPGKDGFETCRLLRQETHIPILMLTARGEIHDRILGLTLGADDYLPKPFEPRELAARLQALLRRGQMKGKADDLRFGDLVIDIHSRQVFLAQEPVTLTTAEFDLLHLLAQKPGHVWDRDRLFERLAGSSPDIDSRSLDVLISRLRQKLKDDPRDPQWIRTVRSVGYLFMGKSEK